MSLSRRSLIIIGAVALGLILLLAIVVPIAVVKGKDSKSNNRSPNELGQKNITTAPSLTTDPPVTTPVVTSPEPIVTTTEVATTAAPEPTTPEPAPTTPEPTTPEPTTTTPVPTTTEQRPAEVVVNSLLLTPDPPYGWTTINLTVSGPKEETPLVFEVSLDGSSLWRLLRISVASPSIVPGPTDAPAFMSLGWEASKDLGFHANTAVFRVRVGKSTILASKNFTIPKATIIKEASHKVHHYLAHYQGFWGNTMPFAQKHQLVLAHPSQFGATREVIAQIQQGVDWQDPADDPIVLCYISVGEDLRTAHLNDAQFAADSRFRGNGQGPRVDPRGPSASGNSVEGLDPLGVPSPGGTGWASYYLDDNSIAAGGAGLGVPDRNPIFGGAFVNAGDPLWFDTLRGMRFDSADKLFGIDELLTTWTGRGLGCDGLFLDTIDTAAPNFYTSPSDENFSKFEWTAAGFRLFMQRLRSTFPDKLILQNRGMFFLNPLLNTYKVTTRGYFDFLLFESFRLNSHTWETYSPTFFPDNLYNYAPKLMAEANRPDGFRVLSLGYCEGPGLSKDTLFGKSSSGYDMLVEDIRYAEWVVGFRHYITSSGVDLANEFVRIHSNTSVPDIDHQPPTWSSTYNPTPWPPQQPPPRVGIQRAINQKGFVLVQWDIALDFNHVFYVLYYKTTPFDWSSATPLNGAARLVMYPRQPWDYAANGWTFANEFEVRGLALDTDYHFLIRAMDDSPAQNEDSNTVTLIARALSG